MKKLLAIFMAVLVVFTTCSIAVFAGETDTETTTDPVVQEENTTRNIKNDDGLVVPINFNQLNLPI